MEWTAQQLRLLYLVQLVSEAGQVQDPTTWTVFQQDGPNQLGLC